MRTSSFGLLSLTAAIVFAVTACSPPKLLNQDKLAQNTSALVLSVPEFTYSPDPVIATKGVVATPANPTLPAEPGMVWSILTPALPSGFHIDAATGSIYTDSAGPTVITTTQIYSVALDWKGIHKVGQLTLTVNDAAPSNLSYVTHPEVLTAHSAATPNTPSYLGGTPTSYLVSPAFPAGILLDPVTGIISGTPATAAASQVYTITALNSGGSTAYDLTLTVNDLAPVFSYTTSPVVAQVGIATTANAPVLLLWPAPGGGGAPLGFTVTPSLPTGLSLDTTSGTISGTPTLATPLATYTITATNTGGSTLRTLDITVNPAPPGFTYAVNPVTYIKGTAITPNTVTVTGGAISSFSVNPALPAGLSLNTSSGTITGTPTTVAATATYTVTGTNAGGTSTAALVLTVNDQTPAFTYSTNPATYIKGTAVAPNVPVNTGGTPTSYAITPALPAGLTFNTSDGKITGTPTALSATTSYTVSVINSGGTASVTLPITVNDIPPLFTYSTTPAVYLLNTAITANDPIITGGSITSFAISPALPAGLSLNTTTGRISGTPTALSPAASYTVTGTGTGGGATASVNITVKDAAPAFTYTTNPAVYVKGTAITANSPINTGGTVVSYGVSPALPAGLSLDTTTGVVSGTPTAVAAAAAYTVTATNSGGTASVALNITVKDIAPAFTYTTNPAVYTRNTAIGSNSPINTGGAVISYAVSPALPAGLTLNSSSGIVSGTPTAVTAAAAYTVTATNSGGTATVALNITVNDLLPVFTYTVTPAIYIKDTAITANSPINTGGAPLSYAVSPALPAGLSMSVMSGVISGTPTAVTAAANYVVTASNSAGAVTATVNITVNDIPGNFTYAVNPGTYTRGTAIGPNDPVNTGGAMSSFSISPALPAGLSFNSSNGRISGTPSAIAGTTTYTVTGTGTGGPATTTVTLTVNDIAPAFTYSSNPVTYVKGIAITANTVTSTGGIITGFSVNPALPAGLSLSTTTGAVTGTPTAVAATATYTVSATNSGGTTPVGLQITIKDIAPALSYATPVIYIKNTAITPNSPTNTGGMVISYAIAPTLPAGLSMNTSTGIISGTPTAVTAPGTYTVTASNSGGTGTASISITVNDIAPAFTYTTPVVYIKGTAITPNSPVNTGGSVTSYAISPALPAGLALNTASGAITGNPSAVTALGSYTVTGTGTGGSATASISITVNDVAPAFTYATNPATYINGSAITANTVCSTGGTITGFSINPALSAGLSLNTTTGAITGTPTVVAASTTYTITGSNSGGSATASLQLTVKDVAPVLTYSTNPAIYPIGTAITSNSPVNTGGAIISYSVSPSLPSGLSFNTTTGIITGTPNAITANATYTVTATNSGGSATVGVQIRVNDVAPAFTYAANPAVYTLGNAITNNTLTSSGGTITSLGISPALPAGLSFNTSNGAITGTPTAVSALATYTVTATNSGGSTSVGVQITVNDSAPVFSYLDPAPVYTKSVAITPANTPVVSGGAIVSYGITPALPAGISLSTTTGAITGTPTALSPLGSYTITGTNSGGSSTAVISLTVNDATPSITYAYPSPTYTRGTTIAANDATNTGGTVVSYSISPALSAGLSLNTTTGRISGMPTAIAAARSYTVTASNSGGSSTASIVATVIDTPPTGLTYTYPSPTYTKGSSITTNSPTLSGGGPVVTYSISPALPAGLAINASTGKITGAASVVSTPGTDFLITATNSGGSTTATINVTVIDAPPGSLSYSTNPATYNRNVAITANTPTTSGGGGTIVSYAIAPALPAGLSMSTSTGIITGTPTVTASTANYTVTGTASGGGSTQVNVGITILEQPPANLSYSSPIVIYPVDVAIINNIPTNTGGPIASYAIAPSLPAGLNFDTNTGIISGTPSTTSLAVNYLVTGTNSGGTTTKLLSIAVSGLGPVVASIFPTGGAAGGGTPVTLTGNYFRSGATVAIGGSGCTSVVVVSGTKITCTTGAHADGLSNVVIANPDLQNSSLIKGFMYSGKVWLGGAAQSANAWSYGGLPVKGSGDGMLASTLGHYAGPDGFIYVVDTTGNRIAKFEAVTGAFIGWIGNVSLSPTGGLDSNCSTTASGSQTPGWCIGGSSQIGTGDGMFNNPNDATIDTNGFLYIADVYNNRIQKFNAATGVLIGWVGGVLTTPTGGASGCTSAAPGSKTPGWCTGGTSQGGAGDGMFNNARAVHVDGGMLYAADRDGNRVLKFNASTGAFIGWIGLVKTTSSMTCTGGTPTVGAYSPGWCTGGTSDTSTSNMNGNGTMASPRGLSTDGTYLYVMETNGYRVDRYGLSTGLHAGWVGRSNSIAGMTCITGTPTAGATNPSWCSGGTSQAGSSDGQITTGTSSRGVYADAVGSNLFIGDYSASRIQRYNLTTGAPTGWIGFVSSVPTGGDAGCTTATVGAMTPGWCLGGSSSAGGGVGQINGAAVVSMDPNRVYLYISDDNNARINRYNLATGASAGSLGAVQNVAPAWIANGVPIVGSGDGVMNNPYQSVSDGTSLFVSDSSNHRIVKFNVATGAYVGWIGNINVAPTGGDTGCSSANGSTFTPGWCTGGTAQSGTGLGMLNTPMGIALRSGILYVADSGNNRISKYDTATGAFLGWIGQLNSAGCGQSSGAFNGGWCATGVAKAGTTATSTTDGRMTTPRAVAVDTTGTYLYVSDSGNSRIYRFNLATGGSPTWIGRVLAITGISGCTGASAGNVTPSFCAGGTSQVGTTAGDGTMNTPYSIAAGSAGDLLVADQGTNRVNWYGSSGLFQGWVGRILTNGGTCIAGAGNFTGGFCKGGTSQASGGSNLDGMLKTPQGVTFDSTGTFFYVTDTGNNRVMKYKFGVGIYGNFAGWQGSISAAPTGGDLGCAGAQPGTATLGWCTGGTSISGNGNGMFNAPAGLSAENSSYLFVGDWSNYRILRLDQ